MFWRMSRVWPAVPIPPDPLPGWRRPAAVAHARLLVESLWRLTGREIADRRLDDGALAAALWEMPEPLVAHGTEADPVFCHANRAALDLWEMDWDGFTRLPSRRSAEADGAIQSDRSALLARAMERGWVGDYAGLRISASGRRFRIAQTVLWTVTDARGQRHGQAALIGRVERLLR